MAKKKGGSAASNRSVRANRRSATTRASVLRAHGQMRAHFEALAPERAAAVKAAAAAVAGFKTVTFSCNNFPSVLVTISTHVGAALLQPSGTFHLPTGSHHIAWSAQGAAGASFDVSVLNGSLDESIDGPLPQGGDGGARILTVS